MFDKAIKLRVFSGTLLPFLIIFVLIFFVFKFVQVQHEQKEINCITYYTSLGYTANGCKNIIDNYIESVNQ